MRFLPLRTASLARGLACGSAALRRLQGEPSAARPDPRHRAGARSGVPATCIAADAYAVELPVTFEGGAGVTRAVSLEEVHFVTARALSVGERIGGAMCFPPAPGGIATTLRFVAWVTEVVASTEGEGAVEVWARFERLEFAALEHDTPAREPRRRPGAGAGTGRAPSWSCRGRSRRPAPGSRPGAARS